MEKLVEKNIDPTQLHPYQYLTQLNSIYSSCNKANIRSYSSVSKMKLAWKPFSIMKIPNCFEVTYENWQKHDRQQKMEMGPIMEDTQKRIWKEHQQIMKRYLKSKQNPSKLRPRTCMSRNISAGSLNDGVSVSGEQPNLLIKRMMQKGVQLDYNKQEVKEEVLKKLQKIQNQVKKKKVWRAQSAIGHGKKNSQVKPSNERIRKRGDLSLINNEDKYLEQKKQELNELKYVDQNEYLNYNRNSEIIADYKKKIKQVGCAISDYNVKKTAFILRNMENIVKRLQ